MNHRPYPNRDDANRAARENEIEQDRREHVARCADTPNAGSVTSDTPRTDKKLLMLCTDCFEFGSGWMDSCKPTEYPSSETYVPADFARELERELATEDATVKRICEDWAHDHTYLQKLCLEAGFSDHEVEGDRYGIRAITQLADLLHSKAAVLGMEKASLAAEMHNLERKNARLEGLLIKLVEAGEKLRKELVIECQKLGDGPREIDEWDAAAKAKEAQP